MTLHTWCHCRTHGWEEWWGRRLRALSAVRMRLSIPWILIPESLPLDNLPQKVLWTDLNPGSRDNLDSIWPFQCSAASITECHGLPQAHSWSCHVPVPFPWVWGINLPGNSKRRSRGNPQVEPSMRCHAEPTHGSSWRNISLGLEWFVTKQSHVHWSLQWRTHLNKSSGRRETELF